VKYSPQPIPTEIVRLPSEIQELIEVLARNAHEVWAQERLAGGWKHGPNRDDGAKKHPCLVSYEDLPESEKEYDRRMALETIKAILALGYRIEKT
jgi:hypothetical protein